MLLFENIQIMFKLHRLDMLREGLKMYNLGFWDEVRSEGGPSAYPC